MKEVLGWVLAAVAASVLMFSLAFGLTWVGIEWQGFFGPKQAAVERKIFKETRSYNEGMIQQLSRYRLQYVRSKDEVERQAILSTVRSMFAEYDADTLPSVELRNFLGKAFN
jgi:hypothetical protein